ncbi:MULTISPECIES: hypothetical protein [Vibrio]|uniref:hypothetical protein n=1 Tax=Vibrio TaxID=662 RepID=UPI000803B9CF|nr:MULTISPECIES: hypothetical protein [Vibrio]ANP65019.1 hypothetical protein BAU10_08445 [Vibrio alginolyticus]MDW3059251.1 hypothetical protein [Vibrio sp. 1978]
MIKKAFFGLIALMAFGVNAVEMKADIAQFKDRMGDRLTVQAISGVRYCNNGRAAVNLVSTDEHIIEYVSVCLSHSEVDQLIKSLEKAKNQFK